MKRDGAYANQFVKFCCLWIYELAQTESASKSSNVIKKGMLRALALVMVCNNQGGCWIFSSSGALDILLEVLVRRRSFATGHQEFLTSIKKKPKSEDTEEMD